ncbi:MAG: hypothetical protein Q8L98_05930 [Chlamydiales bacterium]|nr:hypothetical protein [Chlamydiales bacterium]
MKLLEVCANYFYAFQDISDYKRNTTKTNALALLAIASYFTVVIPVCFAVLFTAGSLCGRANKIEFLSSQDLKISDQAKKIIGNNDKPKATLGEIRNAAKSAAGGEFIHTAGPVGYSYEKLLDMVSKASTEEIPFIIEGALSYQYSTGLELVLGALLRSRDLSGTSDDKEKLKLAIQTITEEKLLELIDKSELLSLDKPIEHRIDFDSFNNLELKLLQKYGKELSLSDRGIKLIGEYIEHVIALCEKTKDNPQFMYE